MRLFLLLLFLLGCDDSDLWPPCDEALDNYASIPMYIEKSCYGENLALVEDGVAELNRMSESLICEPIIEIEGDVDADLDVRRLPEHTIACYHDEPKWFNGTEYMLGYSNYFYDVRLYFFQLWRMSQNYKTALILHELGHYVGIKAHAEYESSVMHPLIGRKNTEYQIEDGQLFCMVYNCKNP